ncbi:hypothetical protein PRIPAC_94842 [Pristionchus pacificus]|uniref:Uncharacterized protein n=1 Tax=Pristionchus pacificus TaxID=54126 RepID=A0A2A6CE76_PRIPA|nr:hypothetical protein PRIPAC_94842 [Pristionchus pacificus]|eukprot:PDM76311.1 hypothetical protein PRIPAC_39915 [Pristionchus pacificus]
MLTIESSTSSFAHSLEIRLHSLRADECNRGWSVLQYSRGWFPSENNPARPAPAGPKRSHDFLWLVQREI